MKNTYLKARIIERFGTQTAFARVLRMSEDRLSKIICGRLQPRDQELEAMVQHLGMAQDKLYIIDSDRGLANG